MQESNAESWCGSESSPPDLMSLLFRIIYAQASAQARLLLPRRASSCEDLSNSACLGAVHHKFPAALCHVIAQHGKPAGPFALLLRFRDLVPRPFRYDLPFELREG